MAAKNEVWILCGVAPSVQQMEVSEPSTTGWGARKTVIRLDYSASRLAGSIFLPYIYCQIVSTLKCRQPLNNRLFTMSLLGIAVSSSGSSLIILISSNHHMNTCIPIFSYHRLCLQILTPPSYKSFSGTGRLWGRQAEN